MEMFFDEPPSFDEVLAIIKQFEDAFTNEAYSSR